jgi:hypothetical protein
MKFQEIDFHVELFRAYLEPPGAQIDYLDMLRKQSKYKRDAFVIKLKSAFDNIQKAYQMEVDKKRFILSDDEKTNHSFSINIFKKHDILIPLANEFIIGHTINRTKLEGLGYLVNSLGVYYGFKKIGKSISKLELERKDEAQNIENKFNPLQSIWMKNPTMTINAFLEKGYDIKLWDEEYNLVAKRGAIYGSGKKLLANIYISLKGNSINDNIDHKIIGKFLCDFFKIKNKSNTASPFKMFQSGEEKQIRELKKAFKINS